MPGNAPVVMYFIAIKNFIPRRFRFWIFAGPPGGCDDLPQHPDWLGNDSDDNPAVKDPDTLFDTEQARKCFDSNSPTSNYPEDYHHYFKKS